MNADEMRFLSYYMIPKDWQIHLIDRKTNEKQLEHIQQIIENARLLAFDTETMPSFYQNSKWQNGTWHSTPCQTQQNSNMSKPSLLQVAIRGQNRTNKNVLLFDLQEIFDRSNINYRDCDINLLIHNLIELIFNHSNAIKLSQSLFNDLAQLKCSYDENCFHRCKIIHIIELSDLYRKVYPNEKDQQIYSLQRMTAMTLHCQLDKKQQCANWSKRPLTQSLKDYAAIDVIVMIDIYDRLKTKIEDEQEEWESFQQSIETIIDLNQIIIYQCICGERFISNKTRNKHARICFQAQKQLENVENQQSRKKKTTKHVINTNNNHSIKDTDILSPLSLPPCGRGYLPPALKQAYQSINQISLYEENFKQLNENRPPDAQFFLDDDDTEVAQAFGLEPSMKNRCTKPNNSNQIQSNTSQPKSNLKIAAYPPKPTSLCSYDENDLIDRLKDDLDSQPEFHCHLFGTGGRGRSSFMHLISPPKPSLNQRNNYR